MGKYPLIKKTEVFIPQALKPIQAIMKRKILFYGILLLLSSCTLNNVEKNESKELKVLSWNVWHGGHSKEYPQKGCDGTKGILKESKADVVLMVETYGCSAQVADELGFYHRLLSDNLSIYSRYPIVKTLTFPDSISTFNFGGAELDVNGKRIRVFAVWLHYLPDERLVPLDKTEEEILAWDNAGTRDDEINKIINTLRPMLAETDSIPIIMGGDFNIHSHLDWVDATRNLYNHGGKTVEWTVSKVLQENGFIDSFRELNPDPAKNIGATWYWSDGDVKDRMDRIDFIYYRGKNIRAVQSEVYNSDLPGTLHFQGKDFFYASDHGFVFTTFAFDQGEQPPRKE